MWYMRKTEQDIIEKKLDEERYDTYDNGEYSKLERLLLRFSRNCKRWVYYFYKNYHHLFFTVSVHAQHVYSHNVSRLVSLMLWPLALTVLLHFAPKTNGYSIITESDKALSILDIFINTLFLIITILNILGTLIRYKIEKVYNRPQSWSQVFITSGIVDLAIVSACIGTGISDGGLALRLVRFIIITFSVINNYFDQLNILLSGLLNGLKSIAYTITLLFLAILTFASLGHYYFAANDPVHFGSFPDACITFFQMSTFENWSDVLFTNVYGCNKFAGNLYADTVNPEYINSNGDPYYVTTSFGTFALPLCPPDAEGNPAAATAIFCLYVIIAGFVIVSMCLAAVVIGITEKLEKMDGKSIFGEDSHHSGGANIMMANRRGSVKAGKLIGVDHKRGKSIEALLQRILDTGSGSGVARQEREDWTLQNLSHHSQVLRKKWHYLFGISCCLILDAILQIVDEIHSEDTAIISATRGWHIACNILFTFEIINALLSYSTHIRDYPKNVWNIIDLGTTIILYLPIRYSSLSVLRFLRIFRLFKVLKTMSTFNIFVELSVVLKAISNSYICVIFVVFLITLFFLLSSIVGILLFKSSDPIHFGNIGNSFRTLFQIMTMDNWTTVMRVNMYGCKYFGSSTGFATDELCVTDNGRGIGLGYYSPIYFIIFVIISNMVLGSVFVGVVITSIDLLRQDAVEEKAINERIKKVMTKYEFNESVLDLKLDLFEMLDFSRKAVLVFEDLQPLLDIFGFGTDRQFEFFVKVDTDKSGQIDFAEFIEMMALMKYSRLEDAEDAGAKGNRASKFFAGSIKIDFDKYFYNAKRMKGVSNINDPLVADIVFKVNPGRKKKKTINKSSFSISAVLDSTHRSDGESGGSCKVIPFAISDGANDETQTVQMTALDTSAALPTLYDNSPDLPLEGEPAASQSFEAKTGSPYESEDRYREDTAVDGGKG